MTDLLKKYISTTDENEIFCIMPPENNDNRNIPIISTEICLTNKRLYAYDTNGNENNIDIVNINNINHITIGDNKKHSNTSALIVIGLLTMITSLIIAFSFELWLLFALTGVGFILIIVGMVKGRTHHQYLLIIHTNQTEIKVDCSEIDETQIISLQQNIFNLQK